MKNSTVGLAAFLLAAAAASTAWAHQESRPRLLDLGSKSCIPCRMMAPILEDMRNRLSGDLRVDFVDVSQRENLGVAQEYGIELIPTQIFLDASGKELWRHEGFISRFGILDKWRELGYAFAAEALEPALVRRKDPPRSEERAREAACFLCDGELDPKGTVVVESPKGDVRLCGVHHYFVLFSCLTEDKAGFVNRVQVTDWRTGERIPATTASYLHGLTEGSGRPWLKAFAARDAALAERAVSGGSVLNFATLEAKELANRCGFCDRACYPEDAALVVVNGVHSRGCCSHCAMGVAARTGEDIEVHERDRRTGEPIVVKTLGGYVASVEPETAIAWFGLRQSPGGQLRGSAGCFHQGFFTSLASLETWLESRPDETGRMIPIDQVLADKLRLTPAEIAKACKIGECSPR